MNGKIKTKFAALFAVALMITVCVVPVVGNEDVQAADVSSTIPEGISDIEIQFFTEDSTDFSDMVYCSNDIKKLPETVDPVEWKYNGGLWININENSEYFGQFLRYGQTGLTNEQIVAMSTGLNGNNSSQPYDWLPMIQVSWKQTEKVSLAIDVNGNNKVTAEPTLTGFDNIAFEEREFVSTIKLLSSNATPNMGCASEQAATGKYDVSMKVDGQVVSEKTIEYYPEAYNVSGYIGNKAMPLTNTTASSTGVIKDEKVTVSYTVDGTPGTVKTDKNGMYKINFAKDSVVAITGITYEGGAYTFDASYNFGTLGSNFTKNFAAKENLGSVQIVSADTNPVGIEGATISLGWYYQYYAKTDSSYSTTWTVTTDAPQGITAGKVTVMGASDENGFINYTYVDPTGTIESSVGKECSYVLVNLSSPVVDGFTFPYKAIESGSAISGQCSDANGVKDVKAANAKIKSVEKIGTINILSHSANSSIGIEGASISLAWYYQTAGTTTGTYNISTYAPEGIIAGTVNVLGVSDEDGEIKFTYLAPKYASASATTNPTAALVNTFSPSVTGYTFDYKAIVSGTSSSLGAQILATPTLVDGSSGSGTLYSKEKTYLINGGGTSNNSDITGITAVDGKYPDVTINYTNGVKQSVTVKSTDGKYDFSLKVIEGNSCVVTPSLNGYTFSPASFTTNSAYADITLPVFVAESTADVVEFVDVSVLDDGKTTPSTKIKASGFGQTFDGIVTFKYSVDGKQYVTPVKANGTTASLGIYGKTGAVVVLDEVSAEGYFISVDSSGAATAKNTVVDTYYFYNGSTLKPVAGFEVEIFGLVSADEVVSLGTIVSDENGLASLERDNAITVKDAIYNGIIKINTTPGTNAQATYNFDVSTYVAAETFDVKIEFISAVNSSDVDGFVAGVPISGMMANTFTAIADSTVALKAPSIDNFEFVAWMVDGVVVSESADYTLKVDGDCHVDALYSAVHYEEPAEGLSMDVLVLGIVIVVLGLLAFAYAVKFKKE